MENYINLYPEIQQAGGLPHALDAGFIKMGSAIRTVPENSNGGSLVTWAFVQQGAIVVEISVMTLYKRYLAAFCHNGVCLAEGGTDNLCLLAEAIGYWLTQSTTQQLAEKYPFIEANEKAAAFDEGREVEYAWRHLNPVILENLEPFVALAAKDEVVSTLFPFTSHDTLCLSHCTGYPYDNNGLPEVTPARFSAFAQNTNAAGAQFVVTLNGNLFLGQGNAAQALAIVKASLPPHIQPAVPGTADDL